MDSFRVVCVNDSAKPDGFIGQWIKKNEIYTVVDAKHLKRQRMTLGYKLAEIDIASDSVYQYFLSNRFRPLSVNVYTLFSLKKFLECLLHIVFIILLPYGLYSLMSLFVL